MEYVVEIKDLCKTYDLFQLKDINLKIPKGSIVGLIGENGAGKSTTMKAMLNLIKKDKGEVSFWGKTLTDDDSLLKEDIGVVFDELNFYETLTPLQIGKICSAAYKKWDEQIYNSYLERFSLPANKEVKTFSRGMQVKMGLTVALSHHAKLLIMDEPTSGLDPIVRDDILDILLQFVQDEDHSVLISSHITSDLEKVADYIVMIKNGEIVLKEEKDNLVYKYGIIRCGEEEKKKINKEDILAARKTGYQWNILIDDKKRMQAKYSQVIIDATTLEEIMLLYVKGENDYEVPHIKGLL